MNSLQHPDQIQQAWEKVSGTASMIEDTMMSSEVSTPDQTDILFSRNSDGESSLTSVPSEIGSTPEGLDDKASCRRLTDKSSSPVCRRSNRQRKLSTRALDSENSSTESNQRSAKRRKTSSSGPVSVRISTDLSSSDIQSAKQALSKAANDAGRLPIKLKLKFEPRAATTSVLEQDKVWPESDIRSEPLPSSILSIPPLSSSQRPTQTSIEADIQLSFVAKIRNQHCKPVNTASGILNYVGPSSYADTLPNAGRANAVQPNSRAIRSTAASGAEKGSNTGSGAASPSERAGKSSSAAKNAKGQSRLGKGKIRNGGNGGRDRDTPEPHEKIPRTHDEQILLKSVRQRQLELKKWWAVVGAQQAEALDIMSSRELSKLHKKPVAHTKVPEYDELLLALQAKQDHVRSLVDQEYKMSQELAMRTLQAQKEIIEKSFLNRAREAKTEHLKGAEGDLMILQNAHKSQIDETRTDNGSEGATNLPLYHELPEPNARIRGYSSVRIDDEKPFKEHLASYDEQAQREVIDDDIVAPVMQSVAKHNAERTAEEERKAREKLSQLALVSESELKKFNSQQVPRVPGPETNPQFALSRLADCADLRSQQERPELHNSAPETPRNSRSLPEVPREAPTNPRQLPELPRGPLPKMTGPSPGPGMLQNPLLNQASLPSPASYSRPKSPPVRKKKSIPGPPKKPIKEEEPQSQSSSNTSTPLPNIALAPSKMPPPPVSNQHHHHHLPQHTMPPLPSSMTAVSTFGRHPSLAPLIIPKTQSTPPGTPIRNQGHPLSSHLPPPPSPFQSRPSPIIGTYQSQHHVQRPLPPYPPNSRPPPTSPFLSQMPQMPRLPSFDQQVQRSPVEQQQREPQREQQPPPLPPPSSNPSRFAINNSVSPHVSRPAGQRRGSGQITFTPTQTPSSERFTRPPGPAPQLPGRSVIRPNQLANGTASAPNRLGNMMVNTPSESRAQSAADIARQNALKNQVQGAGPKGGKRVLLPKS